MSEKTYIYSYTNEDLKDLKDIEVKSLKKASELNDKILDIKIMLDDLGYEWKEYMQFLEDEKISKVCEFRGMDTIEFDEELLNAIVNTLKKSLTDTQKAMNYNSKKIGLNRVLQG